MRTTLLIPFSLIVFLAAGCGGGSSTTTPIVYVTLSPLNVNVALGATQQFTETTSGSTNTDVTWQVNGITGGNSTYGTISATGLYTPPATVPNPATVTVTVISQANTADIANANVTIISGVSVSVSPAAANLQLSGTQQFTATVTGNSNTGVTWQAGGVAGGNSTYGTITADGLYTAPASGSTPFGASITAISKVDATKSGTASVTVHGAISISLAPNPVSVTTFGSQQFTATVSGTSTTGVTWQVNGVSGGSSATGTITQTGLYRAPNAVPTKAANGKSQTATVTVSAISQADSTVVSSVVVTVIPPNQAAQTSPAVLGVSGGNALDTNGSTCCGGTLGALVSRGGKQYILSTNHVLARTDQANIGESIIQPGLLDTSCSTSGTTAVATLSQFANLENPAAGKPVADAALAQVVTGKVDVQGTILELGGSTTNGQPTDGAPLAGSGGTPTQGLAVAKSGRSTGLTCSTIGVVNLTTRIDYQKGCSSDTTFSVTFSNLVAISGSSFSAEGDSGSIVVDQNTSEPVALLVAGSDTDTIAAPVSDVLAALQDPSTNELPVFVGSSTAHAVAACSLPGPQSASLQTTSSASAEKLQTASSVRDAHAAELLAKYSLESVGVGDSLDQSGEAAIVLFVTKEESLQSFPQTIDGVRTRIVESSARPKSSVLSVAETAVSISPPSSGGSAVELTSAELRRASSVQSQRVEQLLKLKGVQGVGIGASSDRPGEAALTIFVIRGALHDSIPAVLDGVRTKVRESSRFHLGSGSTSSRSRSCNAPVKSQSGEYGQEANHEEQYIHSHRLDESLPRNAQK
jgi:hypothetical protein